jgi:23S rRNA (adenine2503-C2)-methyltransferase
LTRTKLAEALAPVIDRPFRVEQIYRAIHLRGLDTFSQMTDLPAGLRAALEGRCCISLPSVATEHAASDGTVKLLFTLQDGKTIETVDIPDGDRRTVCLSSQAGCALACRFCVTGYWGAGRNLTAGEIVAQVRAVERRPRPETNGLNLVFMGMGEPLLNLEHLRDALEILFERISWRRVTVSTVGILPGIEAMASWPRRPRLAISLHAPDDERRSKLMPINRTYPLADLIAALRKFPLATNEKITFEYILIQGINDALEDADALNKLLRNLRAKINLIPINPDTVLGDRMVPPSAENILAFRDRLRSRGMVATVRKQRGNDVSAACGQLRAPDRAPRGFRRSNLSL